MSLGLKESLNLIHLLSRDNLASMQVHRRVTSNSIYTCLGMPLSGDVLVQGQPKRPLEYPSHYVRVMLPERTGVYSQYKLGLHRSVASISQTALGGTWLARPGYIVNDPTLVWKESLANLLSNIHPYCNAFPQPLSAYCYSVTFFSLLQPIMTPSGHAVYTLSNSSCAPVQLVLKRWSSGSKRLWPSIFLCQSQNFFCVLVIQGLNLILES